MPTKLNLASKPFSNRSLPWAVTTFVVFLSLICLVFIVRATRQAQAQAAAVQNDINSLGLQDQSLRQQAQAVKNSLTSDQLQSLNAAHTLVDRKQFSWSRLFADLEQALPGSVRVKRIAVRGVATRGDETLAELELTVVAKTPATVTEMIAEMDRAGIFHAELRSQNLQRGRGESGAEYELFVVYRPRAGAPSDTVASASVGSGNDLRKELDDERTRTIASSQHPPRSDRGTLQRFSSSREQRILGPAEIIGLAGSVVILLLVVVSYLYFLVPANTRLAALQSERSRLQSQLRNSQDVVRQGETTEATVQKITQSLDGFESKQLLGANRGRMGLYDSLNLLIRKNGLRNTSGPTYTPLESAVAKPGATETRSASTKWQSIYPGIAISLTVEGQYQNLRRFIRDLETNKQFVIINSVELERATETNSSPAVEGETTGGTRGALVSLRLEMATYFQRGSGAESSSDSVAH